MAVIHSLISLTFVPIRLTKNLLRHLGFRTGSSLRVLIYHDITPNEHYRFKQQLQWLSARWNFVTPQQFEAMIRGNIPVQGDNLLITFDDGFISNKWVAENVLNPLGIKAIFFIISDFTLIQTKDVARKFISNNIYRDIPTDELPLHWSNLKLEDLYYLIDKGHTIGYHTQTHAKLSELNSIEDLDREIIKGADDLEQHLNIKVEHFAFPFGDYRSLSPQALVIAKRRFPFIYTGLRGYNTRNTPSWAIRRDPMQVKNSRNLIGALIEGVPDLRTARQLINYECWGK